MKASLRKESNSSLFGNAFNRESILAVLQKQMFSIHSGSSYFSLGSVGLEVVHPVSTEHKQLMEKRVSERVMGSKHSEVLWSSIENTLSGSFLVLTQVNLDSTATSVE